MKKLFVIAAVMAAASSCVSVSVSHRGSATQAGADYHSGSRGQVINAGETIEQVREIRNNYSGLKASNNIAVTVSPEVREGTVVVRAGKNIIDMVATQQQGDKLEMSLDTKGKAVRMNDKATVLVPAQRYYHLEVRNNASITLPEGYDARGHVEIYAQNNGEVMMLAGFKAYALQIKASNNGKVRGYAEVENGVSAVASNNAKIELRGHCTRPFVAEASNLGEINCGDFVCEVAQCTASNLGTIRANATQRIAAEATNGSTVYYTGTGKLTQNSKAVNNASIKMF